MIEFEHMPDTGDEFLEYDLQENFEEKAQSMHEAAAATAMRSMRPDPVAFRSWDTPVSRLRRARASPT